MTVNAILVFGKQNRINDTWCMVFEWIFRLLKGVMFNCKIYNILQITDVKMVENF